MAAVVAGCVCKELPGGWPGQASLGAEQGYLKIVVDEGLLRLALEIQRAEGLPMFFFIFFGFFRHMHMETIGWA
jgi:hypothetical protein